MPIGGHFENLLTDSDGISYRHADQPIIINVIFPPGIIGRLYEICIRSANVYRFRAQLIEVPNGILYTLTSPLNNRTARKSPNPCLTGFPPVYASGLRIFLFDTVDNRPPRQVKITTNGCFYKSSAKYTTLPSLTTERTTTTERKFKIKTKVFR